MLADYQHLLRGDAQTLVGCLLSVCVVMSSGHMHHSLESSFPFAPFVYHLCGECALSPVQHSLGGGRYWETMKHEITSPGVITHTHT